MNRTICCSKDKQATKHSEGLLSFIWQNKRLCLIRAFTIPAGLVTALYCLNLPCSTKDDLVVSLANFVVYALVPGMLAGIAGTGLYIACKFIKKACSKN